METYKVRLIGGVDDEVATITTSYGDDSCKLVCSYRGIELAASATDYFDALCGIRLQLEKEGLGLSCYGCSLNVYPSRMAREMGAGLKAYKMTLGRRTSMTDLVEIFSEGPDVIPASVAEQREFLDRWIASLLR